MNPQLISITKPCLNVRLNDPSSPLMSADEFLVHLARRIWPEQNLPPEVAVAKVINSDVSRQFDAIVVCTLYDGFYHTWTALEWAEYFADSLFGDNPERKDALKFLPLFREHLPTLYKACTEHVRRPKYMIPQQQAPHPELPLTPTLPDVVLCLADLVNLYQVRYKNDMLHAGVLQINLDFNFKDDWCKFMFEIWAATIVTIRYSEYSLFSNEGEHCFLALDPHESSIRIDMRHDKEFMATNTEFAKQRVSSNGLLGVHLSMLINGQPAPQFSHILHSVLTRPPVNETA